MFELYGPCVVCLADSNELQLFNSKSNEGMIKTDVTEVELMQNTMLSRQNKRDKGVLYELNTLFLGGGVGGWGGGGGGGFYICSTLKIILC